MGSFYREIYEKTLKQIDLQGREASRLAKKALAWVLFAQKPLSAIKLRHALAIEPGSKYINSENIPTMATVEKVCKGLIQTTRILQKNRSKERVSLIHYTTKEYLTEWMSTWYPCARDDIAETVLTYLSHTIFLNPISSTISHWRSQFWCYETSSQQPFFTDSLLIQPAPWLYERRIENPFALHTIKFWGFYVRQSSITKDSRVAELIHNASTRLYDTQYFEKYSSYYLYNLVGINWMHMIPATIAAYFGLSCHLQNIIKPDSQGTTLLKYGTSALSPRELSFLVEFVVRQGPGDCLRILIDCGASWGDQNLETAVASHDEEKTRILFDAGAGIPILLPRNWRWAENVEFFINTIDPSASDAFRVVYRFELQTLFASIDFSDQREQRVAKMLLRRGCDPNKNTPSGALISICAFLDGERSLCEELLKHGAKINNRGRDGKSALSVALEERRDSVVMFLLNNGASVGTLITGNQSKNRYQLPLSLDRYTAEEIDNILDHWDDGQTLFEVAVAGAPLNIIEQLLQRFTGLAIQWDESCRIKVEVPAFRIKYDHSAKIVELFVRVAQMAAHGKYILGAALRRMVSVGNENAVHVLLENGAPVDERSTSGNTALFVSIIHQRLDLMRLLLSYGANPDVTDVDGRTSLMKIIMDKQSVDDDLEMVSILLEGMGKFSWKSGSTGQCGSGGPRARVPESQVMKRLSDLQLKDPDGNTALHIAVLEGEFEYVNCLIQAGADTQAQDATGRTPLFLAFANNFLNIALLLITPDIKIDLEADRNLRASFWVLNIPEELHEVKTCETELKFGLSIWIVHENGNLSTQEMWNRYCYPPEGYTVSSSKDGLKFDATKALLLLDPSQVIRPVHEIRTSNGFRFGVRVENSALQISDIRTTLRWKPLPDNVLEQVLEQIQHHQSLARNFHRYTRLTVESLIHDNKPL